MTPFFIAGTQNLFYLIDISKWRMLELGRYWQITGLIVLYGVNSFQSMMIDSELISNCAGDLSLTLIAADEFRNDPRNPNAGKKPAGPEKH